MNEEQVTSHNDELMYFFKGRNISPSDSLAHIGLFIITVLNYIEADEEDARCYFASVLECFKKFKEEEYNE